MGHTFSNLLIHIVFAVKHRRNLLYKEIRNQLYAYIAGIVKKENCRALAIGGIEDHIHILLLIKPTACISDIVRKLKSNSSRWLRKDQGLTNFSWQSGYACFSVSESMKEVVVGYIKNQEKHHGRADYGRELKGFLQKHNIAFDKTHYLD